MRSLATEYNMSHFMKMSFSLLSILVITGLSPAQQGEPTPQMVRDAIQKGVDFLKRSQDNQQGNWEKFNAAPIQLGDLYGWCFSSRVIKCNFSFTFGRAYR